MTVVFTQFLFPNARRSLVEIDVPPEVQLKADVLKEAGWQFQCELNPRTGLVLADVCDHEGQLANCLIPNGPGVPEAMVRMIERAHSEWSVIKRAKANTPGWTDQRDAFLRGE